MSQKILGVILCLFMVPFLQGCDESDVVAGAAVGAVVGGAVVAVSTDNYYGNPYYRSRYTRYYRHRHDRYQHRYGHRYGKRRRIIRPGRPGRGHIGRGHRGGHHLIQPASFTTASTVSPQVEKFADFYQMPIDSAQILWDAQTRALNGDVQGLADIGFFAKDLENLVQMKKPSKDTLYRMSLRTGLDEDHVADLLTDFQQEYLASKKAGRF